MKYSLGSLSLLFSLLAAGLLLAALRWPAAGGDTFTVNSTLDATDATPGDGLCETAAGNEICTLRAAVMETNALAGPDTITVPAGYYTLTIPGDDFNAAAGDLNITGSLNLSGEGAVSTIVDGNGLDRVFDVRTPPANTVTIAGLTIRGGLTAFGGGGICHCTADSILILQNSRVISNTATSGGGGGLLTFGTTTIVNSAFLGNNANFAGGGIAAVRTEETIPTTLIISTTIAGNISPMGGLGGGIQNTGVMTITESAIYDNRVLSAGKGSNGGGIKNMTFATLTLINSTVSHNQATSAGAISNIDSSTLAITNSTIFSNTGISFGGLSSTFGGIATLKNTILAHNTGNNCNGSITSAGHNPDSGNSCGFTETGDLINTLPLLGPLQDNDGPTWTHALLDGSPAIDAGDNDGCPPFDQRGFLRPVDGDDNGSPICDMGAYEYASALPGPTPTPTPSPSATPGASATPSPSPTATTQPSGLTIYLPAVFNPLPLPPWPEVGPGSATGGGISNNTGWSMTPSLAIAPDGKPYVAWTNEINFGSNYEIYVRRWSGSSWEQIGANSAAGGGISNNSGSSGGPSLAFAPNGTPYIAWVDSSGGGYFEIYVRRWNGSSWEEVGPGSATGGGISNNSGDSSNPSIAVAPDGTLYIAWEDDVSGNDEIYVRRWNGNSWAEVGAGSAVGGGISNDSGISTTPAIAISPAGLPYIAWTNQDFGGDDEIYLRRWNGSSWEEVGAGSATGGGISNNGSDSNGPSLAIAPDGTPYVAWQDTGSPIIEEIYIRRWNGSNWEEVGPGSASGGGISQTNFGYSYGASLAVALDGTPYVAWQDDSSGTWEIYVRRWNGSSWAEVGPASAGGGGISNNSGDSERPSLAIAPDGTTYIVWQDTTEGGYEIYVRQRPQ